MNISHNIEELNFHRGIIIIDKPCGMTSSQVTDFVKKQLNLNKASHFGTLDPAVTGVLPIALGRASRLMSYFLCQSKEYIGTMHLHEDIEFEKISRIVKEKFLGKIMQLPPLKSNVRRQEREREIKKFEILEKDGKEILFRVECEAGTYIRKLVHDLGQELKIGAHMTELRRTRASIFQEKQAATLYQFAEAVQECKKGNAEKLKNMLIPVEIINQIMPKIEIKPESVEKLKHGSPLFREFIKSHETFKKNDFVAVIHNNNLIEIAQAEISSDGVKNSNLIAKPRTILN